MPQLDRYDQEGMDEDDYDPISMEERLAAERELRRRDREEAFGRRGEEDLLYGILVDFSVGKYSILAKRLSLCR